MSRQSTMLTLPSPSWIRSASNSESWWWTSGASTLKCKQTGSFPSTNLYSISFRVILTGGSLAIVGYFAASMCTTFVPFIIFYGIVGAAGNGITYMVSLICGWEYFPERRGLVTGIIISAYGFGSFFVRSRWWITRGTNPEGLGFIGKQKTKYTDVFCEMSIHWPFIFIMSNE